MSVYYNRLERDGWTLLNRDFHGAAVFEKPVGKSWTLRKLAYASCNTAPGRACYWDVHEMTYAPIKKTLAFPDWEWADVDRKRVVWASGGKIWAAHLGEGELLDTRALHDFNGMKFEAIPAPY